MKQIIFLFFLIAVSQVVFGQSNFQPGLVVTGQDTLRGFINQRDWTRTPSSFEFQREKGGNSKTFTTQQVSYFQIEGSVSFRRFVTLISKDEVGLNNNTLPTVPATVDTVFMEVLRQGKIQSLFRYKDQIKTRYFILDETGNAKELVYQLYSTKSGQYVNNEAFKPQLTFAAAKSPFASDRLSWLIKSATYAEGPLLRIIDAINGGTPKVQTKSSHKGNLSYVIGAGISSNALHYNTSNTYSSLGSSNSVTPFFLVGVDYIVRPEVSRLLWRLDLSVGTTSFESIATKNDLSYPQTINYSFKQLNFSLNPQFLYNFHNADNLKIFAGTGVKVTYSSYSENMYTITTYYPNNPFVTKIPDFFSLRHLWFALPVKAGVVIGGHSEIAVAYVPAFQPINQNDGLWAETINSFQLGYVYRLNSHKK